MKKLLGLVVVLAIAVFATAALAAKPKGDQVDGKGNNNPAVATNTAMFEFHGVKSDFDGSNPKGMVKFMTIATHAQQEGPVVCLSVSGNLATIGVVWDKLKNQNTDNPNEGAIIHVAANGKPVHGVSPDQIQSEGVANAADVVCNPPTPIVDHTLTKGNLHVKDDGVNHD